MGKFLIPSVVAIVSFVSFVLFSGDSFRLLPQGDQPGLLNIFSTTKTKLQDDISNYDRKQNLEGPKDTDMVNSYYNLATDFYEYGWGTSFHFAHTLENESHDDSILRHEHRLSDSLGITRGSQVLDVGCGVGGPARAIANYSGAFVTGITINQYQVDRAKMHTEKAGLTKLVTVVQGDFTQMSFPAATFDFAYAIEATCHAPELADVYGEVFRVLKPGGRFASYEWLLAGGHNATDPLHQKVARNIEYGSGLPPLRTIQQVLDTAAKVGFVVESQVDLAQDHKGTRPWYYRMDMSWISYYITHISVTVMEFLGLAPEGTVATHSALLRAADGLVAGGKLNTFTPMHLVVMKKPLA